MLHPLVDIVCLVHNNLPVTRGFVDHLYANTSNFRLIFVDNGSANDTKNWLIDGAEQKKWTLVRSETNLGIILGRNLGAKHVTADYFLNIDNDQYVQGSWLERLFLLLQKGYDVVGLEAWLLSPPQGSEGIIVNGRSISRGYFPIRRCIRPNDKFSYVGCGGMLIKKKVYDSLGLFDEIFSPMYYEDPDYNFRCLQSGFKIGWCYGCPVKHLAHQTINQQKTFDRNMQFQQSWKRFHEKWYPFYPDPVAMKDIK